jgi:hypothetical protein
MNYRIRTGYDHRWEKLAARGADRSRKDGFGTP